MEAHGFRYVKDGILSALQQVAGVGDSGVVEKIQRRNMHDVPEHPAEMGGTPAAQIRQIIDGELLAVIMFNKVKGRSNDQSVAAFFSRLSVAVDSG